MATCITCGKELIYNGRGRPPSRYCSRTCLESGRAKARRAVAVAEAGDRCCLNCGQPIPASVTLKAKYCSRACGQRGYNRQRAEATRARLLAERGPCPECGDPISPDKSGRWKYCSARCKKRASDRAWRERSPDYNRQRLYGVDRPTWDAILAAQDGRCAICRSADWPGKGNRPHTDHDHASGRFRGVLCMAIVWDATGVFKITN